MLGRTPGHDLGRRRQGPVPMRDLQRDQPGLHHRQRAQRHMGIHMAHMRHPQEPVIGRVGGRRHAQPDAQRHSGLTNGKAGANH